MNREILPFDVGYVYNYLKAALLSVEPEGLTDPEASYFLEWLADPARDKPVPMILHCPACGLQHVDKADEWHPRPGDMFAGSSNPNPAWTNPPHRSHLCAGCGHVWRPADVATVGVEYLETKGKADSPTPVRMQLPPLLHLTFETETAGELDQLESACVEAHPVTVVARFVPRSVGADWHGPKSATVYVEGRGK